MVSDPLIYNITDIMSHNDEGVRRRQDSRHEAKPTGHMERLHRYVPQSAWHLQRVVDILGPGPRCRMWLDDDHVGVADRFAHHPRATWSGTDDEVTSLDCLSWTAEVR